METFTGKNTFTGNIKRFYNICDTKWDLKSTGDLSVTHFAHILSTSHYIYVFIEINRRVCDGVEREIS